MGCRLHTVKYKRGVGIEPVLNQKKHVSPDGDCFYTAVASHYVRNEEATLGEINLFIAQHVTRLPQREGVTGVRVDDIARFEELNPDLHVVVLYVDEKTIVPVHVTKNPTLDPAVLLLFHTKEVESKKTVMHYARIDNPTSLFAKRYRADNKNVTSCYRRYVCWNCFNPMQTERGYKTHISWCHKNKAQKVRMPEWPATKHFKSEEKANSKVFKSAFMLFFDFESLNVRPDKPCSCSEEILENTRTMDDLAKLSLEEREELVLDDVMDSMVTTKEERMSLLETKWSMERRLELQMAGLEVDEEELQAELETERRRWKENPPQELLGRKKKRKICTHKTKVIREQPPFAYSYVLVDRDGEIRQKREYVGEDAAEHFLTHVLDAANEFLPTLSPGEPMEISDLDDFEFYQATDCYLCGEELGQDRVRDHDHLNGRYLGAAHNTCNLKRREQWTLTCFAHNFVGYDSHFVVKALDKLSNKIKSVNIVPLNRQKVKAITINDRIQFLDSLQFLEGSLGSLAEMLVKSNSSFPVSSQVYLHQVEQDLVSIMRKKGVFPYSYCQDLETLRSTTSLPDIKWFHNDLTGEDCTEEDYERAQTIWDGFGCNNMIDYTLVYVESDVLLLADSMLQFRNIVWNSFGLDLCRYLSLPQLAMDAMLKTTDVELDYLYDRQMLDLIKSNIRGGLSFVNRRHEVLIECERNTRHKLINYFFLVPGGLGEQNHLLCRHERVVRSRHVLPSPQAEF